MNELRKDPLFARWIAVLKDSKHPSDYPLTQVKPDGDSCALCDAHREAGSPDDPARVLAEMPRIAQTVVNPHEPAPGTVELVAYYTREEGAAEVSPTGQRQQGVQHEQCDDQQAVHAQRNQVAGHVRLAQDPVVEIAEAGDCNAQQQTDEYGTDRHETPCPL